MSNRLSLLLTALASAGAILSCAVADTESGADRMASVASPILNATDVDDDAVDGVPQLTRRDMNAGCSGVLLTNE